MISLPAAATAIDLAMFAPGSPGLPPRHRQRGSILVPAAVAIILGLLLLGGVQLGYLFYAKRDMQKAADLAALSGAQVLNGGVAADCTAAIAAATAAAQANTTGTTAQAACAYWDPVRYAQDPRHLGALPDGSRYNAMHITLTRRVISLVPFMGGQDVTVDTVAARPGDPVAAFSIGTTLLATNRKPGTLINLLSAVGVNLDQTALVGYDAGLANVNITPAGLLKQLGIDVSADASVGELNGLLAAHVVGLNDLLDAIVTLGGQNSLLAANVTLVHALQAQLGLDDLNVTLGSDSAGRSSSLFAQITAPDGTSALNAQINALQLIATSIGVATGGHAVQAGADINLLGLLTVTPRFSVIEPAQIAIGGVGTTAYSAQVRLFLEVKTAAINVLGLLQVGLDLPIVLDLSSAQGTLASLCDTQDDQGHDQATIDVQSSLLDTCIGDLTATTAFSSSQRCSTGLAPKQLLTLKVAGIDLGVNNKITLDPLVNPVVAATLSQGQTQTVATSTLNLGDALQNVVDAVLTALLGNSTQQGQGQSGATQATAQALWAQAITANAQANNGTACNPAASGATGYNCRQTLWQGALKIAQGHAQSLGGFLSGQPNQGLLTGVGNLLGGLTNVLGNVLGNLLGGILPTNQCATFSLLGGGYGGSAQGCVTEISNTLSAQNAGNQLSNALLTIVSALFDTLAPVLNDLGKGVLGLITNVVGLDLNNTDVTLMSLQCTGREVQIVY